MTGYNTEILSFYHLSLTRVVTVALFLGYDMHKNICAAILHGPLKEMTLEVQSRGEAVAPWYCAKESRLHYGTISAVEWIQGANRGGARENVW